MPVLVKQYFDAFAPPGKVLTTAPGTITNTTSGLDPPPIRTTTEGRGWSHRASATTGPAGQRHLWHQGRYRVDPRNSLAVGCNYLDLVPAAGSIFGKGAARSAGTGRQKTRPTGTYLDLTGLSIIL